MMLHQTIVRRKQCWRIWVSIGLIGVLLTILGIRWLLSGITPHATFRTNGITTSVLVVPDGQHLVALEGGTPYLRRRADGRVLYQFRGQADPVIGIAMSADGQLLATGGSNAVIDVWLLNAQKLLITLHGHTETVRALAFSPDGQTLVSGGKDKALHFWSIPEGQLRRTLTLPARLDSIAFSPDGHMLATSGWDDTIQIWDIPAGTVRTTLNHTYHGHNVVFSPDGTLLAAGVGGSSVKIWQMPDGDVVHTLTEHTGLVSNVAFSPDGSILASASGAYQEETLWGDPTIRLWRVQDGVLLKTYWAHRASIGGFAFSPDGQFLVSASWDQTIKLWHIK